jgi:hypothetical protein
MTIHWKPIIGAVAALVGVKIVTHYFGATASFIAVGALLLSWLFVHLYYKSQLTRIHAQLESLDDERRAGFLARMSPGIRNDLEALASKKIMRS